MSDEQTSREKDSNAIVTSFVVITIIFFCTLLGFGKIIRDQNHLTHNTHALSRATADLVKKQAVLTRANLARIREIQLSRIESCKHTYSGIRDVVRPFYPARPRTQEQQANLDKFNARINKLIKGCVKQTDPK